MSEALDKIEYKHTLRNQLLKKRTTLPNDIFTQKNQLLIDNLITWTKDRQWQKIFSFKAFRNEPNLDPMYEKTQNLPVFLPVMNPNLRKVDFYSWRPGQPLNTNKYGIAEPKINQSNLAAPDQETIIIVPSLACTSTGIRLGYGGGYYDRYLERYPNAITIGVIFSDFLMEKLPYQPHDKKLHFIATDEKVIACN